MGASESCMASCESVMSGMKVNEAKMGSMNG